MNLYQAVFVVVFDLFSETLFSIFGFKNVTILIGRGTGTRRGGVKVYSFPVDGR